MENPIDYCWSGAKSCDSQCLLPVGMLDLAHVGQISTALTLSSLLPSSEARNAKIMAVPQRAGGLKRTREGLQILVGGGRLFETETGFYNQVDCTAIRILYPTQH